MTKRGILLAICENPGWAPNQPVAQQTETFLDQLQQEGWIAPRLDGWEASPRAMDEYPRFHSQGDIADPEGTMRLSPPQAADQASEAPEPIAVVTLDGKGYEIRLERGRYTTTLVGSGPSAGTAFGHYESIRLLAELSRLLGR